MWPALHQLLQELNSFLVGRWESGTSKNKPLHPLNGTILFWQFLLYIGKRICYFCVPDHIPNDSNNSSRPSLREPHGTGHVPAAALKWRWVGFPIKTSDWVKLLSIIQPSKGAEHPSPLSSTCSASGRQDQTPPKRRAYPRIPHPRRNTRILRSSEVSFSLSLRVLFVDLPVPEEVKLPGWGGQRGGGHMDRLE